MHEHGGARQGDPVSDIPVEGRVLPIANSCTRPFWEATARNELLVQWCDECASAQFYPAPLCRLCGGEPGWCTASGLGTVYTFTIVRQNRTPPFDALGPYIVAMIEMNEGPRMMTNLIDCSLDDVRIGMRVEVVFADPVDAIVLPFWRPLTEPTI